MLRTKSFKLYNILRRNARMRQLFEEVRLHEELLGEVRALLPPPLAPHLRALRLRRNRLLLFVDAPVWATRLRLIQPTLLQRLRRHHESILGLDVRVRAQPSETRDRKRRHGLGAEAARAIATAAKNIADPELAGALRRLSRHGDAEEKN